MHRSVKYLFQMTGDATSKAALAAILARTAVEELEIGNLLEGYNCILKAQHQINDAIRVLGAVMAEIPEKEFAIEL